MAASLSGPSAAKEAEWRAEDDHRTMTQAEEIKDDSSRMAGVQKHHKKKLKALGQMTKSLRKS